MKPRTAKISFDYGFKAESEEQLKAIYDRLLFEDRDFEKWRKEECTDLEIKSWAKLYVFLDEILDLGIPFKIESSKESVTDVKAADFTERKVGPEFNEKVQVAVPGLGLLQISKVCLERDCCTDHLQRLLTDGWRIIAVCPQPDQRRPDYILGRVSL